MSAETRDRLRAQKQAYKLRLKVERGTATADDKERLVVLERDFGSKGGARKPRAAKPPEPELDQEHEEHEEPASASEEHGAPDTPPPAFDPPSEPPPKVGARGRASGDWRAKYRSTATGGSDDREATCVLAAHLLVVAPLKKATKYIADGGSRPAFDDAFIDGPIRNLAVVVIDKYTPDGVALSPELELAALGGTVLGQALLVWMRRSKEAKTGAAPKPTGKPPLKSVAPPPPSSPPPAPAAAPERPTPTNGVNPMVEQPPIPSGPFVVRPDTLI